MVMRDITTPGSNCARWCEMQATADKEHINGTGRTPGGGGGGGAGGVQRVTVLMVKAADCVHVLDMRRNCSL